MLFGRSARYLQDFEVPMRQLDLVRAVGRLQSFEIDRDVTEVEQPDTGPRAAQDGVHAREQLLEVERLGDVVVGAEFQPSKLVGSSVPWPSAR